MNKPFIEAIFLAYGLLKLAINGVVLGRLSVLFLILAKLVWGWYSSV
jgi:hypothetical protein